MSIFNWTQNFYHSQPNFEVYAYPQTTSTNELAKDPDYLLKTQNLIFIADQQTQGRGQQQRVWLNPQPGQSLMATWSLPYTIGPQPHYTILIGFALLKSLENYLNSQGSTHLLYLKWPNDIYLQQKKIAGILTETIQQGSTWRLNIGIGLNVFGSPDLASAGHFMNELPPENLTQKAWHQILNQFETSRSQELLNNATTWLPESQKQIDSYLIK